MLNIRRVSVIVTPGICAKYRAMLDDEKNRFGTSNAKTSSRLFFNGHVSILFFAA